MNELSAMFISAQRNLSALNLPVRLFSGAQQVSHAPFAACADTPVMEGLTPRMQRLRNHYLTVRPSVSIYRALAFTEVVKANQACRPFCCERKPSATPAKPRRF